MLETAFFALTWRVTLRRIRASPPAIVSALAFPALLSWIGIGDSYATAAKLFFFTLPHIFLVAAQDAVRSDIDGGALENALFTGGRFRGYLAAKVPVLAAAAGIYAFVLFGLFAAWGLAVGAFEPVFFTRFGLALLAGLYYLALAATLSYFLRAGSNAMVLLFAQAAAVVALLLSASPRAGLLDYAASGRFPAPGPALLFGGLAAVLPNVIVSGRPSLFAVEVAAGLGLALFVQGRLARTIELGR
jgi:hypothetical protein